MVNCLDELIDIIQSASITQLAIFFYQFQLDPPSPQKMGAGQRGEDGTIHFMQSLNTAIHESRQRVLTSPGNIAGLFIPKTARAAIEDASKVEALQV